MFNLWFRSLGVVMEQLTIANRSAIQATLSDGMAIDISISRAEFHNLTQHLVMKHARFVLTGVERCLCR